MVLTRRVRPVGGTHYRVRVDQQSFTVLDAGEVARTTGHLSATARH